MKLPYVKNIDKDTLDNQNFRKVVFTGDHLQLVLMNIKPGEEIGGEVHDSVDQFFRLESGSGKAVIGDKEYQISADFGIVIPAGVSHNILNTGQDDMKIYSIYAPPQHKENTIEPNKTQKKINNIQHVNLFEEFLIESKNDYQVYHNTYSSAVNAALEYVKSKGYDPDEDDVWNQISTGPTKPAAGKTNKATISLVKNGKPQRKALHIQIYGTGTRYELNTYIS